MIAKGYLNAGANVLLTSRDENACKEAVKTLKETIGKNNAECHYLSSNVSSREGCDNLAEQIADIFDNRLDVLVNNAGTSWGEPLDRKSGKANWGFDKVFDLVSQMQHRMKGLLVEHYLWLTYLRISLHIV